MKPINAIPYATKLSFYGIILIIGGFSLYVLSAWSVDHILNNKPVDEIGWIILGASTIRLITIGIALFALRSYSSSEIKNTGLIAFSLFACCSGQLIYPLAEFFVKILVLFGSWESTGKGISNIGAEGWFNHGAAWLIFGLPGIFFLIIGLQYSHYFSVRRVYLFTGSIVGVLLLFLIGAIIG